MGGGRWKVKELGAVKGKDEKVWGSCWCGEDRGE